MQQIAAILGINCILNSYYQAVIKVVDEILSFAEAIFRERNPTTFELKDQVAKCVGIITSLLGAEAKG